MTTAHEDKMLLILFITDFVEHYGMNEFEKVLKIISREETYELHNIGRASQTARL